jgi:hypothetical protein
MSTRRTALSQLVFVGICLSCLGCSYSYTVTVTGSVVMPNESPISRGTVTLLMDSRTLAETSISTNGEFIVVGQDTNPSTTKDNRGVIWLDEGSLSLLFDIDGRKFEVKNLKAVADSSELHFFCSATLVVDGKESSKPDVAPSVGIDK